MALKVDYVIRETGRNLRRNLTLTLASVLTVAVSLSLLGVAFHFVPRLTGGSPVPPSGLIGVLALTAGGAGAGVAMVLL